MTDTLFFIDEDEVLAHHGVKGMKWGVRKQRAASGGAGSTKKRKGLSRKQKAAIAGVLGTAAAAGAGYYLHKSGKGKQLAGLAKKGGASAKKYAQGKGRNLGAQARAKTAASKLKYSKAGKYAEATRLAANAAAFKTGHAARSAGFRAKQGAWKVGNKARRAATGGVSGAKSAAGMAARSAKSKAGAAASAARAAAGSAKSKVGAAARSAAGGAAKSTASAKTPGKALQVSSRAVGYRKLHTSGTKVVRPKGAAADKLVKASVAGLATGVGGGALQYAALKAMSGGKKKRGRSRKRRR